MADDDLFTLQDDLPKEDPWRDDRLGFAPFAERLSKVIANLDAPNGYVIGLQGERGSGKTTALNFVMHSSANTARRQNQKRIASKSSISALGSFLGTRTSLLHF
jgi:predicted KAP-like P-loop ATPase